MNDKERILTEIIGLTAYQTTPIRTQDSDSIYWDYIRDGEELNKGDIVLGMTNPFHRFGIAFFERKVDYGHFVVKEIGSDETCNYSNEKFMILRNFPPMRKLCGHEHKVMMKIRKILSDIYTYRFYNVEFNNKKLTITVRKIFSDEKRILEHQYDCALSRITLKDLRKTLNILDK